MVSQKTLADGLVEVHYKKSHEHQKGVVAFFYRKTFGQKATSGVAARRAKF